MKQIITQDVLQQALTEYSKTNHNHSQYLTTDDYLHPSICSFRFPHTPEESFVQTKYVDFGMNTAGDKVDYVIVTVLYNNSLLMPQTTNEIFISADDSNKYFSLEYRLKDYNLTGSHIDFTINTLSSFVKVSPNFNTSMCAYLTNLRLIVRIQPFYNIPFDNLS